MPDQDELQEALAAFLPGLLAALDHLERLTRLMHPPRLAELAGSLGPDDAVLAAGLARLRDAPWPAGMAPFRGQLSEAGDRVLRAHAGLRDAARSPEGLRGAYQDTRHQYRAIEALYPLAPGLPSVSRFFTEPGLRGDAATAARIDSVKTAGPETGVFHFDNETNARGGFSVYVPEWLPLGQAAPVVFALHGGSGHGRVFLWSWLREARSRGVILVAPTASGSTWSLMEPEVDFSLLSQILSYVRRRWSVDASKMLLSGMSDGGTFTLLSGLDAVCPFTHLAPVAASFHPMLTAMAEPERIKDLPIYLTHGALDWMFPISTGRTANEALAMAGAKVTFREIPDLSHTYPREENGRILAWLMA